MLSFTQMNLSARAPFFLAPSRFLWEKKAPFGTAPSQLPAKGEPGWDELMQRVQAKPAQPFSPEKVQEIKRKNIMKKEQSASLPREKDSLSQKVHEKASQVLTAFN